MTQIDEDESMEPDSRGSPRISVASAILELASALKIAVATSTDNVRYVVTEIVKEIRLSKQPIEAPREELQAELSTVAAALTIGSLGTAILYLGIFTPLAWISASQVTTAPLDILLLQAAPPALDPTFFQDVFPQYSEAAVRPLVFALGSLYGAIALALPFVVLGGQYTRLIITANGILLGFLLTKAIIVDLLGLIELDIFSNRFFLFKLAYLFLAFYIARGSAAILGGEGRERATFDLLADGLYGLFAGWLLGRGFGAGAAFFSGGVFLTLTFLSMWMFGRVLRWVLGWLGPLAGGRYWRFIEQANPVGLTGLAHQVRRAPRELLRVALGVFAIFSSFPIIIALVYTLFLEGH